MTDRIEGLWAALATPLDEQGAVDRPIFARHARWLLDQGCDGVVPFGTTGEGTSFTAAERLEAVEALMQAGVTADQICLGVGYPAIGDTVALSRSALGLGIRNVLALPPYFFRDADEAGLTDAFSEIVDGVGDDRLRLTLYHIPQVSGVAVPPGTLAALRARYGAVLAGLKDSSADFAQFQAFRAAAPEAAITVGNECDIGRARAEGGTGTICGMVNAVPELVRAMFTDAPDAATRMKSAVALMQGPFVPLLRAILAAQTGHAGWLRCRAPLRAIDAAAGRRVADALARMTTQPAAAAE